MLLGSANLTTPGLETNGEVMLQISGNAETREISEILHYFERVWRNETVPVTDYLRVHPDYRRQPLPDEAIGANQRRLIKELKNRQRTLRFTKSVGTEIARNCRVTLPTALRDEMDQIALCTRGHGRPITIRGPGDFIGGGSTRASITRHDTTSLCFRI